MGMNEDFAVYKCIKPTCCCHELAWYYMLIISQQRGGDFSSPNPQTLKKKRFQKHCNRVARLREIAGFWISGTLPCCVNDLRTGKISALEEHWDRCSNHSWGEFPLRR